MDSLPTPPISRKQLVIVVLVLFCITTLSAGAIAVSDGDLHDHRLAVFYSDAEKDGGSDQSVFDIGPEDHKDTDDMLESFGQYGDLVFDQAAPKYKFTYTEHESGDTYEDVTYEDWRWNELQRWETQDDRSDVIQWKALPASFYQGDNENAHVDRDELTQPSVRTDSKTDDGKLAKSFTSTIVAYEDGVEMTSNRFQSGQYITRDSRSTPNDRYWVPSSGSVYVWSDYILDESEEYRDCTDIEWEYETRTETYYEWVLEDGRFTVVEKEREVEERVFGERSCDTLTIDWDSHSVTHELQVADTDGSFETVVKDEDVDRGAHKLSYDKGDLQDVRELSEDVNHRSYERVRVKSTVTTEYREETNRDRHWHPDQGWGWVQPRSEKKQTSVTVESHYQDLVLTDTNSLDVTQTVIELEHHDTNFLHIEIDGPIGTNAAGSATNEEYIPTERELWSRMYFTRHTDVAGVSHNKDMYVRNVWGAYSARGYNTIRRDYSSGPRDSISYAPQDEPLIPELRMGAAHDEPTVVVEDPKNDFARPDLIEMEVQAKADGMPSLEEDVRVPNQEPIYYDEFIVRHAPREIGYIENIHGDEIHFPAENTETKPGLLPDVSINTVGSSNIRGSDTVQVSLRDPDSGDPIPNRTIYVEGGMEAEYTTNRSGNVYFERTGSHVVVQTKSDDLTEDKDVYYVSAVKEKSYLKSLMFMDLLVELLVAFLTALPFIFFYMWLNHTNKVN